jgi:hypothetical protein
MPAHLLLTDVFPLLFYVSIPAIKNVTKIVKFRQVYLLAYSDSQRL